MTNVTTKTKSSQPQSETAVHLFDNWFDPIEAGLRDRVRELIHAMIEGELDTALSRPRYARHAKSPSGEAEEAVGAIGHRHGHRSRSLLGSFGRVEIEMPRARLNTPSRSITSSSASDRGCRLLALNDTSRFVGRRSLSGRSGQVQNIGLGRFSRE
jgi:putative transposase